MIDGTVSPTLEAVVGGANVVAWDAMEPAWQRRIGRAVFPATPIGELVFPNNQAELAAVVGWANHTRSPLLPCGRGSKLDWGGLVKPNQAMPLVAVSSQRINRLIEHAVGDLTVTVEAGMGFAELQQILGQVGQFLAIDPAYPEEATIGGIVATGDTGSLRQRYNSVRDMLLGLSFVRADGRVAKAGGRVVKNVAGYDLMKLLTGSYGTLGFISQVTFRVYPLPEASQTVVLSGAIADLEAVARTVLSSALTPTQVDWLSVAVMRSLAISATAGLALRFQSIAESVAEQSGRLVEMGQALGLDISFYQGADETDLWQRLQAEMLPPSSDQTLTGKIGIRPSQTGWLLQQLEGLSLSHACIQIHAASGLGRLVVGSPLLAPEVLLQLRQCCQRHSGFLSVLQAPVALKQQIDVWGYSGNALHLMQALKQQFDPASLLSPHRFVGGI